jgi:hypothetical protein
MLDRRVSQSFWALRVTFAAVPFLAGVDKFFNLLADWQQYLSPAISHMLPLSPAAFMMVVGVIEMAVGLGVLSRYVRSFAFIATAWLVLIAGNLVLAGHLDIAVRDLAMAVGALCLAQLSEVVSPAAETRHGHIGEPAAHGA